MATQSILKSIFIRDKKSARDLVNALEKCEKKSVKKVEMSKPVKKVEKKDIVNFWGKS